jgi:hypothetical protein
MPPRRKPDQPAPKPTSPTENIHREAGDFHSRASTSEVSTGIVGAPPFSVVRQVSTETCIAQR